jgi:hypothetical protein
MYCELQQLGSPSLSRGSIAQGFADTQHSVRYLSSTSPTEQGRARGEGGTGGVRIG